MENVSGMSSGLDSVHLRQRLNRVLDQYGMTLQFVCRNLGWKYHAVNKFKNDKADMSLERKRLLSQFLDKFDIDQGIKVS